MTKPTSRHDDELYRVRWREGWDILTYLYRHPTDTAQIARVIEALQGRSVQRITQRLASRPKGRALLERRPSLRDALADRPWLESLAPGSLGEAYLHHCRAIGGMTEHIDEGTSLDRTTRLPELESIGARFGWLLVTWTTLARVLRMSSVE